MILNNKKKNLYTFNWKYILIWILLFFSGNPFVRLGNKYIPIAFTIILFILFYKKLRQDFYIQLFSIVILLCLLFFSQKIVLGFVSWPGSFNFIMIFFLGGLIFYLIGNEFPLIFLDIVAYISIISLAGYLLINIGGLNVPSLEWKPARYTYVFYTYVKQHHLRNCGMFWEPGAFAGIITLAIALNLNELPRIWSKYKFKVIVILVALITTQSTTGYLVLFVIALYYLLFFVKSNILKFSFCILLTFTAIVVYESSEFLKEKVEHQSQVSLELDQGEFSNNRFGSLVFDFHYIKKHPIIGNGLHEITRYADNPEIIQFINFGGELVNANGFSNSLASLGIPFLIAYFMLIYHAAKKFNSKVAIIVVITIMLSFFSEQWLKYPLFTGIVFLRRNQKKNSLSVNDSSGQTSKPRSSQLLFSN